MTESKAFSWEVSILRNLITAFPCPPASLPGSSCMALLGREGGRGEKHKAPTQQVGQSTICQLFCTGWSERSQQLNGWSSLVKLPGAETCVPAGHRAWLARRGAVSPSPARKGTAQPASLLLFSSPGRALGVYFQTRFPRSLPSFPSLRCADCQPRDALPRSRQPLFSQEKRVGGWQFVS